MKNKIIIFLAILSVCCGWFSFSYASSFSDRAMVQVNNAAGDNGGGLGMAKDPQMLVADIINILLGAVGVIFTGLIFYGGMVYLTAQGEEEKAKKGAGIVKASVIGLLVVLASYAIVLFVSSLANEANVATEDYYL